MYLSEVKPTQKTKNEINFYEIEIMASSVGWGKFDFDHFLD
jgi:hypothetical protein